MAKFLYQAAYSVDGIKGVLKEGGSARRAAVEAAAKALGGRVEAFYYAFGDVDVLFIVDGFDNAAAAAFSMTIAATGAGSIKTTVLMSTEEIDQAAKKTISYRAPGR
jgi:uncharacterized protein with GYD domain